MKKLLFAALALTVMGRTVNAQTGSILLGESFDMLSGKVPAYPAIVTPAVLILA